MNEQQFDALLLDYVEGLLSDDLMEEVREFAASSPERQQQLDAMQESMLFARHLTSHEPPPSLDQKILDMLQKEVAIPAKANPGPAQSWLERLFAMPSFKPALAFCTVILVVGTVFVSQNLNKLSQDRLLKPSSPNFQSFPSATKSSEQSGKKAARKGVKPLSTVDAVDRSRLPRKDSQPGKAFVPKSKPKWSPTPRTVPSPLLQKKTRSAPPAPPSAAKNIRKVLQRERQKLQEMPRKRKVRRRRRRKVRRRRRQKVRRQRRQKVRRRRRRKVRRRRFGIGSRGRRLRNLTTRQEALKERGSRKSVRTYRPSRTAMGGAVANDQARASDDILVRRRVQAKRQLKAPPPVRKRFAAPPPPMRMGARSNKPSRFTGFRRGSRRNSLGRKKVSGIRGRREFDRRMARGRRYERSGKKYFGRASADYSLSLGWARKYGRNYDIRRASLALANLALRRKQYWLARRYFREYITTFSYRQRARVRAQVARRFPSHAPFSAGPKAKPATSPPR